MSPLRVDRQRHALAGRRRSSAVARQPGRYAMERTQRDR